MAGLDGIGSGGGLDLSNYLSALGKSANVDDKAASAAASVRSGADSAASAASDIATLDRRAAVRHIVADYDLHEISPREFSELTGRLYDAGAISDTDRANFALLRRELDAAGIDPDEAVDLFTLLEEKLAELRAQSQENESGLATTASDAHTLAEQTANTLSQYDWLVKLDTIRQLGDSATVDQRA